MRSNVPRVDTKWNYPTNFKSPNCQIANLAIWQNRRFPIPPRRLRLPPTAPTRPGALYSLIPLVARTIPTPLFPIIPHPLSRQGQNVGRKKSHRLPPSPSRQGRNMIDIQLV